MRVIRYVRGRGRIRPDIRITVHFSRWSMRGRGLWGKCRWFVTVGLSFTGDCLYLLLCKRRTEFEAVASKVNHDMKCVKVNFGFICSAGNFFCCMEIVSTWYQMLVPRCSKCGIPTLASIPNQDTLLILARANHHPLICPHYPAFHKGQDS